MADIRKMLSEEDIQKIDEYRKYYVDGVRTCGRESMVNIDTILQPWADAKSDYLTRLFPEGQTILEKEVTISQFANEISNKIYNEIICNKTNNIFFNEYRKYVDEEYCQKTGGYSPVYWNLISLIGQDNLAQNSWIGSDFEVVYEENGATKIYRVQKGAKIMKILAKLCKIWHLDSSNFETFRIKHSQILNEAHFTGKLCLSIHPLDFMTMSDNNCKWTSCMSWDNEGEYHQGTIEMMNSPMVVETYLKSSADATLGTVEWNNKKWRELFVVNHFGIFAIKGYPYWNRELEKLSLEWISSLAANVFHVTYSPILTAHVDGYNGLTYYYNKIAYKFSFETCHMYNDFCYDHAAMVAISDEDVDEHIYYSGDSECMCCGRHGDDNQMDVFSDANICCEDCQEPRRCCICGESLCEDNCYTDGDGNYYCEDCWCDRFVCCNDCGEDIDRDEAYTIEVCRQVKGVDGSSFMDYVTTLTLCRWCFFEKFTEEQQDWLKECTKKNEEKYDLYYDGHNYSIVLDDDCSLEKWMEMSGQYIRKWW